MLTCHCIGYKTIAGIALDFHNAREHRGQRYLAIVYRIRCAIGYLPRFVKYPIPGRIANPFAGSMDAVKSFPTEGASAKKLAASRFLYTWPATPAAAGPLTALPPVSSTTTTTFC